MAVARSFFIFEDGGGDINQLVLTHFIENSRSKNRINFTYSTLVL